MDDKNCRIFAFTQLKIEKDYYLFFSLSAWNHSKVFCRARRERTHPLSTNPQRSMKSKERLMICSGSICEVMSSGSKHYRYGNQLSYTPFEKSNLVQKFNFDKTPTFSRVFHPNFFGTIFLVKSKLSTAKKPKTTTFSRVFYPKNSTIFSDIKVEFLDKKWRFRTVCSTPMIHF